MTPRDPEVSVCIPVFNAERWIETAISSALQQTHQDLEVVVVDNASTDSTIERIQAIADPRVRLYANSHNVGACRNWNRTIALARGGYIKFLCADDVLYPDCVEAMLRVFRSDPQVGLVFSDRDIELEDHAPAAISWKAKHEATPARFGELHEVNSGEALLSAWMEDQFASNWIGEPSNVMISRECLGRIGAFNFHMEDRLDMDLWVRAMLFYSIGYVARPLSSFLVRSGSLTSDNRATGKAWLDRLWFLEGLLTYDEVAERYPEISRLRRRTIARLLRNALLRRITLPAGKVEAIRRYGAFRLRGHGDQSKLYGWIDDALPPAEIVAVRETVASPPQT